MTNATLLEGKKFAQRLFMDMHPSGDKKQISLEAKTQKKDPRVFYDVEVRSVVVDTQSGYKGLVEITENGDCRRARIENIYWVEMDDQIILNKDMVGSFRNGVYLYNKFKNTAKHTAFEVSLEEHLKAGKFVLYQKTKKSKPKICRRDTASGPIITVKNIFTNKNYGWFPDKLSLVPVDSKLHTHAKVAVQAIMDLVDSLEEFKQEEADPRISFMKKNPSTNFIWDNTTHHFIGGTCAYN